MARSKHRKKDKAHAPAHAPGPDAGVARDLVDRELNDPERLTAHLRRLSELLTIVPPLREIRFPQDALLDALANVDRAALDAAPAEKKGQILRTAVVPKLATEQLARAAKNAFQQTIQQAREQNDRLALIAGTMLVDAWLRTKKPAEENPIWDSIFGLSVLDSLFEGALIAKVVRESLNPDEGNAAKSFARALGKADLLKELERLGLTEKEPQQIAKRYAEVVRDQRRSYLLGFDALLRLVRANSETSAGLVQTILAEGLSPEIRKKLLDAFDGAFSDDITKPLVDDLCGEITRRLEQLLLELKGNAPPKERPKDAEPPESELRTGLVALLALRAIPIDKNQLLRATYLGSFEVYRRGAPVEELAFVQRIWQDPTDRWAIEEYEKLLLTRRHTHRAARVRRYLEELRAAARGSAGAPASGGGGGGGA